MQVFDVEQRSEEWFNLRKGKITSTRLKSLMGKEWLSVIDEIVAEEITGFIEDSYINDKMQWGIDNEPIAVSKYESINFVETFECGFCVSDKYNFLGLSPDRFVGFNGGLEIKCPSPKTHIKYIRQDKLPTEYIWQVVNYFIVNEDLDWVDFVSYDPRNKLIPLWTKKVYREDVYEKINDAYIMLDKAQKEIIGLKAKLGTVNNLP